MRPVRMVVDAMGPFAEAQEIDFDGVGEDGLFLIWGPTGAGKSFILDALCYALYGRAAGDRPLPQLHSDHARGRVPTVELTFRLGGDEWCVRREAPRWRTRRDGTLTQTTSTAVLERRAAGGSDVVATKVTDVDRIIRDRMGLDVNDFRRVVLLPQGRFERVLRASSAEREDLLKSIFGTTLFEDVASELDARANGAARAIDEVEEAQQRRVDAARSEWIRLADDLRPAAAALAVVVDPAEIDDRGRGLAADDPASSMSAAAAYLNDLSTAVSSTHRESAAAARTERAGADALGDRAARWDERETWRARLASLDASRETVAATRGELEAAERAAPVAPVRAAVTEAAARLRKAVRLHGVACETLERVWSNCPVTLGAPLQGVPLTGAEIAAAEPAWLIDASATIGRRSAEVEEAAAAAERATAKRRAAAAARARATAAARVVDGLVEALADAETEFAVAQEAVSDAEIALRSLDDLAEAVAVLAAQAASARRLPALDERRAKAEADSTDARRAEVRAQAHLADLHRRRAEAMAAELADGLVAGEPCPVCGGCEHPAPAPPIDGAPGRSDIETADAALVAASSAREAADARASDARQAHAEAVAAAGPAAQDPRAVATQLGQRRQELDRAQRAAAERDAGLQAVEQLDAVRGRVRGELDQARVGAADAGRLADGLDRDADAAQAGATAVLGRGADAESAGRARDALAALAGAVAAVVTARGEADARRAATAETNRALDEALAAAGFPDGPSAETAWRSEADRRAAADRVAAWDRAVADATISLTQPVFADLPDERPDSVSAEAAAVAAEARRDALARAGLLVEQAAGRLADLAAEHREEADHLVAARADHEVRHRLAQICNGRTGDRVSLQRWVLASHFESICARANDRLAQMTSGRYALRVHTGSTHGRGSGLDLRVFDAHSGEERDVASLSGGETFQASLALALGVADVVAERVGGLELGVLFVDEGFGSLDADALHLALDELDRLRAGGRMVGVISHVGGLRERITTGIEVRPDRGGSRVLVGAAPTP